jgi:hypothetical protein
MALCDYTSVHVQMWVWVCGYEGMIVESLQL